MSVLHYPRLYFTGETEWNPSVTNNSASIFSDKTGNLMIGNMSDEDFHNNVILSNTNPAKNGGDWNLYGNNSCSFKNAFISGGHIDNQNYLSNDPIIETPVKLLDSRGLESAKLVDINPYRVESQIYFDSIRFGSDDNFILLGGDSRLYSRWLNFARNLNNDGKAIIAGTAGSIWQVGIKSENIEFKNTDNSQIISSFVDKLSNAKGLVLRFSSYLTNYYFKYDDINNQEDLHKKYLNGFTGDNPAKSYMVGSLGLWLDDETSTAPPGRLMKPVPIRVQPDNNERQLIGPFTVQEVDESIAFDLSNCIPEVNQSGEKANLGDLILMADEVNANNSRLVTLKQSNYSKKEYEKKGGCLNLKTDSHIRSKFHENRLKLIHSSGVIIAEEVEAYAICDNQCVYLNKGEEQTVSIRVFYRGNRATNNFRVRFVNYDYEYKAILSNQNPNRPHLSQWHVELLEGIDLPVDSQGEVNLTIKSQHPGSNYLGFIVYKKGVEPEIPYRLDKSSESYMSIRVLPFDDHYSQLPDSEITWDLMYEHVFRYYHLLYPGMSKIIPFNNKNIMETFHERIAVSTDKKNIEKTDYMPVTRELSAGKRHLIKRWSSLLQKRANPT